jgi:hypothetical protein
MQQPERILDPAAARRRVFTARTLHIVIAT